MRLKKRKGNLAITVLAFFALVIVLGSLFSIVVSQRNAAMSKAVTSGDTNSYIALSNLCADAFKDDLEAQTVRYIAAGLENPGGLDSLEEGFGLEIYDDVIVEMQTALQRAEGEDGSWYHHLTNPYDAIDYAGITDVKARTLLNRLLTGATVTIEIDKPLKILGGMDEDNENLATGDRVTIDDIYFTVTLKKGATKIVQNYCLTGEIMTGRYEETIVWCAVDGDAAECNLQAQKVCRHDVEAIVELEAEEGGKSE